MNSPSQWCQVMCVWVCSLYQLKLHFLHASPGIKSQSSDVKKNAGTVMCNYLVQVCTWYIIWLFCCTCVAPSYLSQLLTVQGLLVESLEALGRKTWSPETENILGVYTQRFVAIRVFRRVSCHCWCVEWHDEPPDASPGPPGSGRLVRP